MEGVVVAHQLLAIGTDKVQVEKVNESDEGYVEEEVKEETGKKKKVCWDNYKEKVVFSLGESL